MNLVTCPDCRSAVPSHVAACPQCGRPLGPARRFVETPAGPAAETPARWPAGQAPVYGQAPLYGQASAYGRAPVYGQPTMYGDAAMYGQAAGMDPRYDPQEAARRSAAQLVYGLYAGSFLFSPLAIVALVLSYTRRGEVRGSWLEAHYAWVIDTFWMSMAVSFGGVMAALAMMFLFMPMGILSIMAVVAAAFAFPIYRLVVGWTALGEGRAPVGKISSPRW